MGLEEQTGLYFSSKAEQRDSWIYWMILFMITFQLPPCIRALIVLYSEVSDVTVAADGEVTQFAKKRASESRPVGFCFGNVCPSKLTIKQIIKH